MKSHSKLVTLKFRCREGDEDDRSYIFGKPKAETVVVSYVIPLGMYC